MTRYLTIYELMTEAAELFRRSRWLAQEEPTNLVLAVDLLDRAQALHGDALRAGDVFMHFGLWPASRNIEMVLSAVVGAIEALELYGPPELGEVTFLTVFGVDAPLGGLNPMFPLSPEEMERPL